MRIFTCNIKLLTVTLATLVCLAASAATDGGDRLITLRVTDQPLPQVLKTIERKGGKSILFTYNETKRYRVTADIRGKTEAEAIGIVLRGKPFSFVERSAYFVVQYAKDKTDGGGAGGTVTDSRGRPLAFANVVILSARDSSYIAGCVTEADGSFLFPSMPEAKCLLKVSFVGYKTVVAACHSVNSIRMEDDTRLLRGVTVTDDRPMIERKGGNLIANVAGSALAHMGSADEMISHLPFVSGEDGSYNVIGRGAAEVYVNGRKVRDGDELQRIQATEIQQAEIIMNPGARYSDEVGAVIRLKTLRRRGQGLSGSANAEWEQGRRGKGREGFALNYRTGGLDIFAKGNFKEGEAYSTSDNTYTMTTSSLWRMTSSMTATSRSAKFNGEAGFNYEPDQRQSLGMRYVASTSMGDIVSRSWGTTIVYRDGDEYDNLYTESTDKSEDGWNHSLNAYYTATFGQWGIDFNADYYGGNSRSWQQAANDGAVDATSYNDVDNSLYAAKLVVTTPLLGGTLAFGTEETFTDRRDRFVQSGFSANADDHLRQEYYSAFADYSLNVWRLSLRAGTRYEHQRTRYYEAGVFKAAQSPTYDDLIPSASVSYSHKDVSLSLAYRMMKFSPLYDMLSSKVNYSNKYMYKNGDPLLVPQKHHMVTVDGGWRWVNVSMWYDYCVNMYTSYFKPYDDATRPGVMLQTMASIPYTNQYGMAVDLSPTFGVWTPHVSADVSWYDSDATSLGIPYFKNRPVFGFTIDNSLTLSNGWFVNLKASYNTRAVQSYAISQPSGRVKLRVEKTFFEDKSLRIALTVNDVFRTGRYRFTVYGDRTFYDRRAYNDDQRVKLSINYTFNATKSKYRGKGAGEAEKQRL